MNKTVLGRLFVLAFISIASTSNAFCQNMSHSNLERMRADTDYISKEFNIPMLDGYLVFPNRYVDYDNHIYTEELLNSWRLFFAVQYYRDRGRNFGDAISLANFIYDKNGKIHIIDKYLQSGESKLGGHYIENFAYFLEFKLNEFDKRRFKSEFDAYLDNVRPIYDLHNIFIVSICSVSFGSYDFSNSFVDFNVTSNVYGEDSFLGLSGIPVRNTANRSYGTLSSQLFGRRFKENVYLPDDQAEEILRATEQSGDRRAFLGIFGDANIGGNIMMLNPHDVKLAYDSKLERKILDVSLEQITINEIAEQEKERAAAASRRESERDAALAREAAAIREKQVEFPERDLEILGVRIGDSVSDALATLSERFSDKQTHLTVQRDIASEFADTQECWGNRDEFRRYTELEDEFLMTARLDGRKELSDSERGNLEDQRAILLESMPSQCASALLGVAKLAFSIEIELAPGVIDTLNIYKSGLPKQEHSIVAITRKILVDGNLNIPSFRETLKKKYGDIFITTSYVDYWIKNSETQNKIILNSDYVENCIKPSPWPLEIRSLNFDTFDDDCGEYIASRDQEAYLINTKKIVEARTALEKMLGVKKGKVAIDF